MKSILRSKSDTNIFFEKEFLDSFHQNIIKMNENKISNRQSENNKHNNKITKVNNKKKWYSDKDCNKNAQSKISKRSEIFMSQNQSSKNINKYLKIDNNQDRKNEEPNFKNSLRNILLFKMQIEKKIFKKIKTEKLHINLLLEVIMIKFKKKGKIKLLENKNEKTYEDSIYESPMSEFRFDSELEKNKIELIACSLIEKFENFENILKILISTSAEELFREIKFLILIEYERITLDIQMNLEKLNKETASRIFAWTTQTILFVISIINYKLEYFSLSINSLIDKMNDNMLEYLENAIDDNVKKYFSFNLNMIHKYVLLKKYFIKEVCSINPLNFASNENEKIGTINSKLNLNEQGNKICLNKLSSFGKYFFNNCYVIVNSENQKNFDLMGLPDNSKKCFNNKEMIKKRQFVFNTNLNNNFIDTKGYRLSTDTAIGIGSGIYTHSVVGMTPGSINSTSFGSGTGRDTRNSFAHDHHYENNLERSFKYYFTFKLANWNYTSIKNENLNKNNEICRICEISFSINEFILHIHFCKEQRINISKLYEINKELASAYEQLKQFKQIIIYESEVNKIKDILFSPKCEITRKLQTYIDQTPKLKMRNINMFKKNENDKSELQILNALIDCLFEEKDQNFEDLEKHPQKFSRLLSIVQLVLFFLRNKNENEIMITNELISIFLKLLEILVKKIIVLENILNLKHSKDRAKMKIKNVYLNMQPSILFTPMITAEQKDSFIFKAKDVNLKNKFLKNDSNYISPISEKEESTNVFMKMLNFTRNKYKPNISKISLNPKSPNLFGKSTQMNSNIFKLQNKDTKLNTNPLIFINKDTNKNISKNINNLEALRSLNFDRQVSNITNTKNDNINFNPVVSFANPSTVDKKNIINNKKKIKEIGKELKLYETSDNQNNIISKFSDDNRFKIIRESIGNETEMGTVTTAINPSTLTNYSPLINLKISSNSDNYWFTNQNNSPFPDSPVNFREGEVSDIHFNSNSNNVDNKILQINLSGSNEPSNIQSLQRSNNKNKNVQKSFFGCQKHVLAEEVEKECEDEDNNSQNNSCSINKLISFRDSLEITKNEDFVLIKPNCIYFYDNNEEIGNLNIYKDDNNDDHDSQLNEIIDLFEDIQAVSEKEMSVIKDENELEGSDSSNSIKFNINNQMKITHFKFIIEIAKGGYGRVDIYKKISTGDMYAIKTENKNVAGLLKNETLIFNEIFSDYVVKCFRMFSDENNYYYVMEYMRGGNLLNLINNYNLYSATIQFIIAEVILGLEYLHSKEIIHRDLKPANILISYEGHFKLTDFGISEIGWKQNKYALSNRDLETNFQKFTISTNTILGTEHYLAPEVLNNEMITSQVDYWSLGVLIFELFTNKLPFYGEDFSIISDNIKNLKINWEPFDSLPEDKYYNKSEAKDLINKFLNLDSYSRWGYWNIEDVKKHEFFKKFDWDNIKNTNDIIIKKHVLSQIHSINDKIKKENLVPKQVFTSKDDKIIKIPNIDDLLLATKKLSSSHNISNILDESELLNSERVDNLYLICHDVIKNNFKHKTYKRELEGNFINILNELNN